MKMLKILATTAALGLFTAGAHASEKTKLMTAPASQKPRIVTAIDHGSTPVTTVQLRHEVRRSIRNGYSPYYSYRPYYGGYGYGYGGYYTRPYYGYNYYSPGGWGGYGYGPNYGFGPMARVGGWWW